MWCKKIVVLPALITFIKFSSTNGNNEVCNSMKFDSDTTVCKCDLNYCDFSEETLPSDGQCVIVTSNKFGLRFNKTYGNVEPYENSYFINEYCDKNKVVLRLDRTKTFNKVVGFGGGFTDSNGINIAALPEELQDIIIRLFYSKDGLNLNMARVPIGTSDFADRVYTLDDVEGDVDLKYFSLKPEDYEYKIPYIKKAMEYAQDKILIVSAAWVPPYWMQSKEEVPQLLPEYYEVYAKYLVRFLEMYKDEGIDIWRVSAINEPSICLFLRLYSHCLGMKANEVSKFIVNNLGPELEKSEKIDTKVLLMDDVGRNAFLQPSYSPFWSYKGIEKYLDVAGIHWYFDDAISPTIVQDFLDEYTNVTLLDTEMSWGENGQLGNWTGAEEYAGKIIQEFNYGTSGWFLWNLVLNFTGGPRNTDSGLDAAIIMDKSNTSVYKQPTYYAFGHFSKYLPRDSLRIEIVDVFKTNSIQFTAALRPDNFVSVVLYNRNDYSVNVVIGEDGNKMIRTLILPNSITTIVY